MPERTLTYEDLAAMPDDGKRRELLGGELVVSPFPKTRHQRLSRRLTTAFESYLTAHGGGEMFDAPMDVLLSDSDVVQPDLLVICDADREIVTEDNIQGVRSLVIEIVSESRYDRVRKRHLCRVRRPGVLDRRSGGPPGRGAPAAGRLLCAAAGFRARR